MTYKRYVIERDLPDVGSLGETEIAGAAETSNGALAELAPEVQWIESFVAADKTFCIYLAQGEEAIRTHAERSGFPASRITEIARVIDPTTAQA
ncbi:hypothetical protein LNKW23_21310 [Paralimibaculum aggregatum]|uniref:DUF4242 domain-containing protein n=1 Tax=Paralimibaculum aggregatum TaxID=3036245 RepID=A0ABQ6LNW1_9RHOB|nr:DUF4242 domain-containing protein [Limibaculum sp. NKW23]GMG82918.1 hypothetical protein LNKW23_21310 [Limibaculum sp. NKW23]